MANSLADFQIQPLAGIHLPGILELDKLCFGGWWNLAHYQWELDHPESHFLVMTIPSAQISSHASIDNLREDPGLVIGIGGFWQVLEEAHINILAIHPQYQGQGLGKLLLNKLLYQAKILGLERATLEVRASNQIALALYQKFGFQEAGRRPNYYPDNAEEGVILWMNQLQYQDF
jgi:[ribosomal protein S18]-alanine N-acetyltransferase